MPQHSGQRVELAIALEKQSGQILAGQVRMPPGQARCVKSIEILFRYQSLVHEVVTLLSAGDRPRSVPQPCQGTGGGSSDSSVRTMGDAILSGPFGCCRRVTCLAERSAGAIDRT